MSQSRHPLPHASAGLQPRRGKRKRRIALWTGLALVLALGLAYFLLAIPLTLPGARADIEARLERLIGSPVAVTGSAEFSLFPRPRVTLSRVQALTEADGTPVRLEVDRLEADFDLLDALGGTADIRRVTLIRPEFAPVDPGTAPPPFSPPPAGQAAPADPTALASAEGRRQLRGLLRRFEGLDELRVRDGLLRLPGAEEAVSSADLDFRWTGESDPATLTGSFVWNGQPASVRAQLERPVAFFDGEASPLQVLLSGPSGDAGFTGQGAGGQRFSLSGVLRLSTPSLARAARWLGEPSIPDFGALTIETQIELFGDRLNLGSANLDLGGSRARGAMEAVLGRETDKSSLSGTLAFEDLDLTRILEAVAPLPRSILDLQRPVRVQIGRDFDVDLRLSAERARFGPVQAGELAAAIKVTNGSGALDVGDMAVLGGRGGLRLRFARADDRRPTLDANLRLNAIDMRELAALSEIPLPISVGNGDLEVTLQGPAADWGDILTEASTTLSLRVSNGRLLGFPSELMRTSGRHQIETSASGPAQAFQSFSASVRGTGSRFRLDSMDMATEAGEAEAQGFLDARTLRLTLSGRSLSPVVEASGAGGAFTSSQPIPFTIRGEWPRPVMTVDAPEAPI